MNTVDDLVFKVKGKSVKAPMSEVKALPEAERQKAYMRMRTLGSTVAGFTSAPAKMPPTIAMAGAGAAPRARSPSPKPKPAPSKAPKKDLYDLGMAINDWMLAELMKNKGFAKAYEEEGDEMDTLVPERDLFGETPRENAAMLRKVAKAFPDVDAKDVRDALVERYEGHYMYDELVRVLKSMRISDTRKKSK